MAVIYNTNYTHNPNSYLTLAVERAARALFGSDQILLADNMTLAGAAASGEHDTLICIDGQRINTQLMRRIRPAFKTMILWTFEDPFMRDFNVENSNLFDYVFTNDPSCAEHYRGKGHYLPLGASRTIHQREVKEGDALDYDIFFAGTMWPNRVETLRRIIAAFPQARLKLICPGNEYLPPLPADLAELAIQRPVSHEAFIDFANASAVTLTMFRDYASHGDVSQATAPGPRFYELALAGAAQVVEAPESMDTKYFAEIEGTFLARDIDGVVSAVAALLGDRNLRHNAALSGQRSALEGHLYENRLSRMAEITGANFGRTLPGSALAPRRRRLRVLMCTHSTIHEAAWGGVEVYQQTLCSMLGREIEFFYWLRRGTHCRLTTANGQEVERYDVPEVGWMDAMCDGPEEMAFSNAISQYNFDIVHFQHLGHHALSLPIIAKACGAGVVFSAHDFWLISSRYNLLNQDQRYIEDEVKSVVASDIILKVAENIEYGGEQTRRAFIGKMLHSVDTILFGTEHSRNLTHEIYPILDQKRSLTLGIPSPENTIPIVAKSYEPLGERPLKVAIVGNFLRTKGADTILNLIEIAHPDHIEFHIFGYVHPEYDAVLNSRPRPNVKVYGRYTAGDIAALQVADVALNLSIWPETYCISLSEAWQNGLIPIVTDVGALGDRVQDGVNGFKVPIGRANMVLERLELLRSSEVIRREIMGNISPALWTQAEPYANDMRAVYQQAAPVRELGTSEMQIDAGQVHLLPHASWRHQAPPRHIFDPPTIRDLSIELPEPVSDWFSIQGAEYYIDDVCHFVLADNQPEDFSGAYEFHIRGWHVLPGVSSAGSMYAVLIGDAKSPLIFLPCVREARGDVLSIYPNAPRRSGFSGQAALRGKWCEGSFRVGLVNIVNGAGAFMVTSVEIGVKDGKINDIQVERPSNDQIMRDFIRVSHADGHLRGIKLNRLHRHAHFHRAENDFQHYIDSLSGLVGDPAPLLTDDGNLFIRGWGFLRQVERAGDMSVALVGGSTNSAFFFALKRFLRHDVKTIFPDAPLCVGFEGWISIASGYAAEMAGDYRLCLVNTVGEQIGIKPLDALVTVTNGIIASVTQAEVSEAVVETVVRSIEASFVPESIA
ncbi:glycosyltransferase [Asaia astilbis]|uniref:glycosyltransferase n=1 Tax=Asaia astilbis TaxID=610244 RepID=UPI00046F916E|nr:glycosyltransferase [Asaia astilbis]